MTKYLTTGTHSHGTLRSEDLAECFADLLESMNHNDAALIDDLRAICERGEDPTDCEVIGEAIDALQEYCPPYCYFGTNEGDGSDFGVWFSGASFEDACDGGEVIRVSDLSEIDDIPREEVVNAEYVAVVNDHGNVSLYPVVVTVGKEVWSFV